MLEYMFGSIEYKDICPLFSGYEKCLSGKSFGPAIRDYCLIHYIISGKGRLECEGENYEIKAGEIFIIKPSELTVYTADKNEPWEYVWIGFTGDASKFFCKTEARVLPVRGGGFVELYNQLCQNRPNPELCISIIFEIISENQAGHRGSLKYASKIADYIECNYMRDISVMSIAKMINLDSRYASRLFKAEYGMPIGNYLMSCRLKKAKAFLKDGYSVSQTAKMCGYNDVFNFSKMFKKRYGISPSGIKKLK